MRPPKQAASVLLPDKFVTRGSVNVSKVCQTKLC
jgi:hypothetical protein